MINREDLIKDAKAALQNSYSPYSKFKVGAAVLTEDGKVYKGTNIENASYGLTCCAERVAIFSALTDTAPGEKKRKMAAIAIVIGGENAADVPTESLSPCGACRQVMSEFMDVDAPVFIEGTKDYTVGELLPYGFVLNEDAK